MKRIKCIPDRNHRFVGEQKSNVNPDAAEYDRGMAEFMSKLRKRGHRPKGE